MGIAAGAVQGYFGGWVDLIFQRFIEIWAGLPTLFIIIIIASIIEPTFWTLLTIMLFFSWWRHVLPNAMVATLTFLPFVLVGAVTVLTSLDFLGFGLPPPSPSLGELLNQGKRNLQAPWLGLTGFFVLAIMLSLLVFVGEAVRDAFDVRKTLSQTEGGEG